MMSVGKNGKPVPKNRKAFDEPCRDGLTTQLALIYDGCVVIATFFSHVGEEVYEEYDDYHETARLVEVAVKARKPTADEEREVTERLVRAEMGGDEPLVIEIGTPR